MLSAPISTYRHMFDVIWAHPSAQGHGSEWWLEAVHVEQKGTIVTLDERGYTATPEKKKRRSFLCQDGTFNQQFTKEQRSLLA